MTNVPNKILGFRHSTFGDLFYKYQTKELELYSCRVLLTAAGYPQLQSTQLQGTHSCRVP